jgi:hypothetical protein
MPETQPQKPGTDDTLRKERIVRAQISASSELLFVVLPFIVIAITLRHRGEFHSILYLPEWSIVSAVVMGQAIIRLVYTVLGDDKETEVSIFIITLLLVFGLVPILVVLSIVLIADKVSTSLAVVQGVGFLTSTTIFWFASLAQEVKRLRKK